MEYRGDVAFPSAPERFYLPELDILRFFAFLSVFLWHVFAFAFQGRYTGPLGGALFLAGANGVHLFFALSAYLITQLLMREREATGTVDVRSFYVRRILRIWPLYFFFLGVAFVLSALSRGTPYYDFFFVRPLQFVAFLLLLGNFAMVLLGKPAAFVAPLWSISVEEQFYLIWPWVVRKAERRTIAALAVAMIVVSSASCIVLSLRGSWGEPVWFNTLTCLSPIGAGILLAATPQDWIDNLQPGSRIAILLAGLAAWLLPAYYSLIWSQTSTPVRLTAGYLLSALGSAAFLVTILGIGNAGSRFLLGRWLTYLGKISYGLYVYHMLAVMISKIVCIYLAYYYVIWRVETYNILYAASTCSLTVLLAACSYRWLETPFLRMKRRFTHLESRPV